MIDELCMFLNCIYFDISMTIQYIHESNEYTQTREDKKTHNTLNIYKKEESKFDDSSFVIYGL